MDTNQHMYIFCPIITGSPYLLLTKAGDPLPAWLNFSLWDSALPVRPGTRPGTDTVNEYFSAVIYISHSRSMNACHLHTMRRISIMLQKLTVHTFGSKKYLYKLDINNHSCHHIQQTIHKLFFPMCTNLWHTISIFPLHYIFERIKKSKRLKFLLKINISFLKWTWHQNIICHVTREASDISPLSKLQIFKFLHLF